MTFSRGCPFPLSTRNGGVRGVPASLTPPVRVDSLSRVLDDPSRLVPALAFLRPVPPISPFSLVRLFHSVFSIPSPPSYLCHPLLYSDFPVPSPPPRLSPHLSTTSRTGQWSVTTVAAEASYRGPSRVPASIRCTRTAGGAVPPRRTGRETVGGRTRSSAPPARSERRATAIRGTVACRRRRWTPSRRPRFAFPALAA